MPRPRWGWAIWFWASRRSSRWKSHQTSLEKKVEFKMFPVRKWYVPFCQWQQSLLQVTVNVTKMVKHEDHESFSSPENLCLIEVTADIVGLKWLWKSWGARKHQFQSYIWKEENTIPILYFSFPTQSPFLTMCPLSPWHRFPLTTPAEEEHTIVGIRINTRINTRQ